MLTPLHLNKVRANRDTSSSMDLAPALGPTNDGASDANLEVNLIRSTSGVVFFLARAAISWIVKKQHSIALHSTDAEIQAGSLAACEAIFLRGI